MVLMEMVAQQMGEALAAAEDAGLMMVSGGQCVKCNHRPYSRWIWLYRHLRAKHAD